MCETKNVEFVDHYNGFLLASGDIADSYYHRDKLHPNTFGTRKLLRNLDAVHRVTSPNTQPQPAGPARRSGSFAGRAGFHSRGRGYHNGQYRNGPKMDQNIMDQNITDQTKMDRNIVISVQYEDIEHRTVGSMAETLV